MGVEALGLEAIGRDASEESRRLFIAYFRTHARLEDPIMWDLFRECPAFNAATHEPLLQDNEKEEEEIRMGLDMLADQIQGRETSAIFGKGYSSPGGAGYVPGSCSSKGNVTKEMDGDWAWIRAKVANHTSSEERLLKKSGLLEACEEHLDRRWTEIMEKTHQDAQILYDEFRKMNLSLEQILKFVRGMVADWPAFPELRQRTALRMRQVRHEMPVMLEDLGTDILGQITFASLAEYWRWIQLERAEGLALNLWDEISLHFSVLPYLLGVSRNVLFCTLACFLCSLILVQLAQNSGKKKTL